MRERIRLYIVYVTILILLAIASYFITGYGFSPFTTTMISVVAFLFGILGGFSITILWNRFTKVREELNEETSCFHNIWSLSAVFGKELRTKLANTFDKYLITTLEFPLEKYYSSNVHFEEIRALLQGQKINNKKQEEVYGQILDNLDNMDKSRNNVAYYAQSKLLRYLSTSVYILSCVLIFLMFYTKTNELLSALLTFTVCAVVILVVFVIIDLNKLRPWERVLFETNVGELFDMIGKLRFYDVTLLSEGRQVPRAREKYRTRAPNGKIITTLWRK